MVSPEHHDGVAVAARVLERRHDAADTGIHVRDAGVVGGDGLAPGGVRHGPVDFARPVVPRHVVEIVGRVIGQRDRGGRIHVEIAGRRVQRQVRPVEAEGEEQRLIARLFREQAHALFGDGAVGAIEVGAALRSPDPGAVIVLLPAFLRAEVAEQNPRRGIFFERGPRKSLALGDDAAPPRGVVVGLVCRCRRGRSCPRARSHSRRRGRLPAESSRDAGDRSNRWRCRARGWWAAAGRRAAKNAWDCRRGTRTARYRSGRRNEPGRRCWAFCRSGSRRRKGRFSGPQRR